MMQDKRDAICLLPPTVDHLFGRTNHHLPLFVSALPACAAGHRPEEDGPTSQGQVHGDGGGQEPKVRPAGPGARSRRRQLVSASVQCSAATNRCPDLGARLPAAATGGCPVESGPLPMRVLDDEDDAGLKRRHLPTSTNGDHLFGRAHHLPLVVSAMLLMMMMMIMMMMISVCVWDFGPRIRCAITPPVGRRVTDKGGTSVFVDALCPHSTCARRQVEETSLVEMIEHMEGYFSRNRSGPS